MKAASVKATSQPVFERRRLGDRIARRLVTQRLRQIRHGVLIIDDGEDRHVFGELYTTDELAATITVENSAFFSDLAFGGSIGAGESFMQGHWRCDDLIALVRLMTRNRDLLDGFGGRFSRLIKTLGAGLYRIDKNTRRGARRNIAAHYDIGNEFFSLWLDESMMYSCAIFPTGRESLAEAQVIRLNRVCEQVDLQPDDHLVEIGTGWGQMAIHAARNYGCRITTTTISQEQYDFARRRIDQAGLSDRITLLLTDYRDLDGTYDKLVSLEMIEAIGYRQHETYFSKCAGLLHPGGKMLIQSITIENDRYEQYKRKEDFIQRYIFPGGCLPSQAALCDVATRAGEFTIDRVDDIGRHYATTLQHWRQNFHKQLDRVRALGYPETFIRMWEYYLCYCEGGFRERAISTVHLCATRTSR